MTNENYQKLKSFVNMIPTPSVIMSVEKLADGSCGEVRFEVINDVFKNDYYEIFIKPNENSDIAYDEIESKVEGQLYTLHLPKEMNFEDICFRAAWHKDYITTYVDTTRMYGFWTQDILNPIAIESDDPSISYCQFSYTLNKEMDSGKFATVSPDIASFVIKSCLELRNEKKFHESMEIVTRELREYTNSFAASTLSIDKDFRTFEIISADVADNSLDIRKAFSAVPYDIIESWEELVKQTNSIIIKDEHDMAVVEEKAPEWVKTLRDNGVYRLCLVPFMHQDDIIGYLYITNFDLDHLLRVKETTELVSFFLSSEVANHLFLQRLEYLSNVDMLTGVYNRNCMNVNVDELSLKLEFNPRPFNVAFCDLNGLKTINDNDGHSQGDKLLVYAAQVLKEVFSDDKIFRAGGDEFTIISFSTQAEFEKKIELLREKASDPDWLYFAIGYYYDASSGNLRLAMRYADEQMYIDKDKFYEAYPEKRR
ncbi:sensor domain-containing diguanylate cyclase [Butyrivibrio sp. YAB3001]|uniref:sensor domain-containing diguanylate cyclase n=1 Tax=Butyrivibrio sp. YAB3001 TaxID=1520812 RepID=UPI0008F64F0F|nr:GGDEF domain-containing protein [Butyrivibrio sp. YAB3001]SFB69877.1 diguanylate cyclase (GGDEF) domain-containing protein [Butyrivibrio sp. YAB3001]